MALLGLLGRGGVCSQSLGAAEDNGTARLGRRDAWARRHSDPEQMSRFWIMAGADLVSGSDSAVGFICFLVGWHIH